MAKAPCQLAPSCSRIKTMTSVMMMEPMMEVDTCANPSPKTILRMARSWESENSRPTVNIRKTTPNSASPSSDWASLTSPVE